MPARHCLLIIDDEGAQRTVDLDAERITIGDKTTELR